MKRIAGLPQAWFMLFLLAAWLIGLMLPRGGLPVGLRLAGGAVMAAGFVLIAVAIRWMRRAGTTVMPGRVPDSLVTGGPFRLGRNPIYLGNAMILLGFGIWLDSPFALLLVPVFVWLITRLFILEEEARLRAAFGESFAAYCRRTRRWL